MLGASQLSAAGKPWLRLAPWRAVALARSLSGDRAPRRQVESASGGGSELAKQRCAPCEKDDGGLEFMGLCEALSREEASRAAAALEPAWDVVPLPAAPGGDGEPSGGGGGGLALQRGFRCKNFLAAVELCHRIGRVAEEEQHHPDLHLTGWNKLRVVMSTHSRSGVTHNDRILAAKVNALAVEDLLRKKKKPKFEEI